MWLTILIKYWKFIIGAIALLGAIWYIYDKGYNSGLIEGKSIGDKALIDQQISLQEICSSAKKLTEKVSTQYETNNSQADSDFNTYILHDKAAGVSVATVTSQTSSNNATTATEKHAIGNGVRSVDLIKLRLYARKAEKYRLQLIGCQNFINEVWNK